MNIYFHELKIYKKVTAIWTIALVSFMLVFFAFFPSLTVDITNTQALFEGFPDAVKNGMGLLFDSFGSILGYYAFPLTFILLIGGIQAMNLGISIVSKEIKDATADFLLTKPLSRSEILTSKILAAFSLIIITNFIYISCATMMANFISSEPYSFQSFLMISLSLFYVQTIFLALGLFLSIILPKLKSVLSVSLATVFIFYFLSFLSTSASDDVLRYFTPFKYFDVNYIVANGQYEIRFIVIAIVVVIMMLIGSYVVFQKKDIQ